MKEESTNRQHSIMMPAVMASAVGAGIMLLLTPKTGREIRKDLKRFAANARDQVAEVIDEGREVVVKAAKIGKETYDEGTERLENFMYIKERSRMVPILASGIIGAGVALLLVSKSGKEVRGHLKRIATNTRDNFVSAIDKGRAPYMEGIKAIPEAV